MANCLSNYVSKYIFLAMFQFVFDIHKEMMGLIGAGNNPMVGMTVAVAVAIEEAMNK